MVASSVASPLCTWLVAACMSVSNEKDQFWKGSSDFQSSKLLGRSSRRRKSIAKCSSRSLGSSVNGYGMLSSWHACFGFEPCEEYYKSEGLSASFSSLFAENAFSVFGFKQVPLNRRQRRMASAAHSGRPMAAAVQPAKEATAKKKPLMRNRRVVVTGLGVASPIGHDPDTFYSNLLEGISGISQIEGNCTAHLFIHLPLRFFPKFEKLALCSRIVQSIILIDHRSSSKIKKSMQQQEICQLSVIWRGKKFSLEMDPTATLKSLGDKLLSLTNVRDDTMRLIVPTNKSSRLLYPFSEEHSCLKLEAASILEGKSIRMLGVPKAEVDDILQSAKADLRIVGFDEEEKRMRQRISNGLQSSLKLPQGPYVFCDFRTLHLPGIELNPSASKALKLMHKLAADPGIVAIMNKHRWCVGIMTEMAPEGSVGVSPECILGFNKNHGEEISLRLRTDDLKGFRKYDSIKKTLLHELAHMVHSEHDVNFYALLKQLNEEAAKLDWTKSSGHTLSGGHNSQHYEDDEDNDNLIGLPHKLGGQTSVFNARASSVAAAYSRLVQASTNPSEEIEMHQASNAGDSLQSNHVDVLLEKQLNDVKVESLEKHNGVFIADVPSDDRRKSEPDPDDCETGSAMKHEAHIELDSDDHKTRSLPPPLEAKLSEEPDPDDCSAGKQNTVSPTSLEPDPDEHTMGIEKKVTAGQNSHVSLGHNVNEEERESSNQDGFPEGVKLVEPYTNDKDRITDRISSTVIDEPDPDDQELQRIQDPVSIICSRLQKAVGVLRSQANPLEASRVVQTILKIIRNAIEHPDEVKFRKLRKANPVIQRDVVSYPAAMDILSVIGFSEDTVIDDTGRSEAYLVLKRNDPGLLWLAKSSLENSIS